MGDPTDVEMQYYFNNYGSESDSSFWEGTFDYEMNENVSEGAASREVVTMLDPKGEDAKSRSDRGWIFHHGESVAVVIPHIRAVFTPGRDFKEVCVRLLARLRNLYATHGYVAITVELPKTCLISWCSDFHRQSRDPRVILPCLVENGHDFVYNHVCICWYYRKQPVGRCQPDFRQSAAMNNDKKRYNRIPFHVAAEADVRQTLQNGRSLHQRCTGDPDLGFPMPATDGDEGLYQGCARCAQRDHAQGERCPNANEELPWYRDIEIH